jgi:hypothetical protein
MNIMIQFILDFLMQSKGDVIMAVFPLALIPAIASIAQTGYGMIKEGENRRRMAGERQKWSAENEALFNKDNYGDYTQRPDAQSVIRQMKDQIKKQDQVEQNVAAVTGATPEVVNAGKERRNKAMTDVYSNIGANAMEYKDRAKGRYLGRKAQLQGLEYDNMNQDAQSANNVMYNGMKSLSTTDWAGIVGGGRLDNMPINALTTPTTGIQTTGPVKPVKLPGF